MFTGDRLYQIIILKATSRLLHRQNLTMASQLQSSSIMQVMRCNSNNNKEAIPSQVVPQINRRNTIALLHLHPQLLRVARIFPLRKLDAQCRFMAHSSSRRPPSCPQTNSDQHTYLPL